MIEVRNGLFETNSSSTHAIVVSLKPFPELRPSDLYTSWSSCMEFGREEYRLLESWELKLAYIYIVMLDIDNAWRSGQGKIEAPKVDLQRFKTTVESIFSEVSQEVMKGSKLSYEPWNTTPTEMFKVLDFVYANPGQKPDFTYDEEYYKDVIEQAPYGAFVDHIEGFMLFATDDRRLNYPLVDLIEKLQASEDYLKSFLFSDDSYITIGGDEYRGYNLKTLGFEYDYDTKDEWKQRVQEYEKTHDVYFKGN